MQLIFKSLFLILFMFSGPLIHACSCNAFDLEDICEYEDDAVVIKGEFIERINHGDGHHSVLVKVVKALKGNHALSDTIELIGGSDDGLCITGFGNLDYYREFYLAFTQLNYFAVDTTLVPAINHSYKRFSPTVCNHLVFDYDENKVEGMISISGVIYSYPIEKFEQRVKECDFNKEDLLEYFCPEITILPNPLDQGNLRFNNNLTLAHAVDAVAVYNINGQRIYTSKYSFTNDWFSFSEWNLPHTPAGIFIVEIQCGENRIFKKIAMGF